MCALLTVSLDTNCSEINGFYYILSLTTSLVVVCYVFIEKKGDLVMDYLMNFSCSQLLCFYGRLTNIPLGLLYTFLFSKLYTKVLST